MIAREAFNTNTAGAMAGIAFTGCDLRGAARARARAQARPAARGKEQARPAQRRLEAVATSRRRQVVVAGRRVKTIDVHAHCVIPEAYALLGLKVEDHRGPGIEEVGPRRIREMDSQGIDMEALSINPRWYRAERDVATEVISIQNQRLAEFCGKYPDRFVAFASVALQFPDLAVQQLADGVKKFGLPGAAVGARVAPDQETGVKLKKKPTESLRQMYYDTLVFASEALRRLAAQVGASQLVLGTDHPIPWQDKSVYHVLAAPGFTGPERRAMLGETAAKLLKIKL